MIKTLVSRTLKTVGLEIRKIGDRDASALPPDLEPEFVRIYEQCRPYTMTSPERMYALWQSIHYVCANKIPGSFVECGVWKGGSSMLMALTLKSLGQTDRDIYLFDTFAGMSAPTEEDKTYTGSDASPKFKTLQREDHNEWVYASLETVQTNLFSTHYPKEKLHFLRGKVEDTIPQVLPETIALLRLDTDFYESTKHELIHLYPQLQKHGVLIIDDYGHWLGARKAVDEFLKEQNPRLFLGRIDYTGRVAIKPN